MKKISLRIPVNIYEKIAGKSYAVKISINSVMLMAIEGNVINPTTIYVDDVDIQKPYVITDVRVPEFVYERMNQIKRSRLLSHHKTSLNKIVVWALASFLESENGQPNTQKVD